MIDRDPTACSYPGGVKAAEMNGIANVPGGDMSETHGGDVKKIGKKHGMKAAGKKEMKPSKGGFGKKVAGK